MKLVRTFSDEQGESHFEDIEMQFADTDFIPGAQSIGLSDSWPAERVSIAKIAPGWADPKHPTPARQLVTFLSGAAEMKTSDGETRTFRKGDAVLLEDTSGSGHGTRFVSGEDSLVILMRLQ